jgi:lysine-specific permease
LTGFIAWLSIALSHYSFRRAYIAQGNRIEDLKFKAKLYPFGPVLSAVLCICIILGQFYAYGDFTVMGFIVAYIGLFIFLVCYLGYKYVKKTKWISPLEADLKHYPDKNV